MEYFFSYKVTSYVTFRRYRQKNFLISPKMWSIWTSKNFRRRGAEKSNIATLYHVCGTKTENGKWQPKRLWDFCAFALGIYNIYHYKIYILNMICMRKNLKMLAHKARKKHNCKFSEKPLNSRIYPTRRQNICCYQVQSQFLILIAYHALCPYALEVIQSPFSNFSTAFFIFFKFSQIQLWSHNNF